MFGVSWGQNHRRVRFSEFGLADEEFDLTRLLIALTRELAFGFVINGSLCAELGCAEDIGAGDAGGIAGVNCKMDRVGKIPRVLVLSGRFGYFE